MSLIEFNQKSYITSSSGFYGEFGEFQQIDGNFPIDSRTKKKIENLGAEVLNYKEMDLPGWPGETCVRFFPKKPDLNEMKKMWNKIAAILPDLKKPLSPSISGAATDFLKQYAPHRIDIEKLQLQRLLEIVPLHPTYIKKYQKRLKQIESLKKNT